MGPQLQDGLAFAAFPRAGQASPRSFPQNLSFKLRANRQQPSHYPTGRRGQVQHLGQRHEAHSEMLQFLKGHQQICNGPAPAVESLYQHDLDLPAPGGLQQFLTQSGWPPIFHWIRILLPVDDSNSRTYSSGGAWKCWKQFHECRLDSLLSSDGSRPFQPFLQADVVQPQRM